MGKQEESKIVEGDPDRAKVVEDAEYDGIGPSNVRNERVVDTNALRRDRRPGGHMGELARSKGVESDWRRRKDGEGVGYARRRGGNDGTTSGTHGDSKRVDPRPLAEGVPGQHGKRKRRTTDVPGPSRPPPTHPRPPTEYVDPPRRRGRLKSRPRRVSQARVHKCTYQVGRRLRGVSDVSDASHIQSSCWGSIPEQYQTSTTLQKARIHDRAHSDSTALYPSRDIPYMVIARALHFRTCRTASFDIHSNIHFHWNMKGRQFYCFLPTFLLISPYSLRGSVENSSHMGFIFSSLHKHNLISVVEYCSFSLVTTL